MYSLRFCSYQDLRTGDAGTALSSRGTGLWSVTLGSHEFLLQEEDGGKEGFLNTRLVTLKVRGREPLPAAWLQLSGFRLHPKTETALANGYQCWTYSPLLGADEVLPPEPDPRQKTFGDDGIYPYAEQPGIFHSWSFSYSTVESAKGNPFFGALDEDLCYSVFEFDLHRLSMSIAVDVEGLAVGNLPEDGEGWKILGAWVVPVATATEFLPLGQVARLWMDALRRRERTPRGSLALDEWRKHVPVLGYTSWYYKYTQISEDWLRANLHGATPELRWQVFQVDDGYQAKVGDWLLRAPGFPNGVEALVPAIAEKGMVPGLWCAPFVAVEGSQSFEEHQDWLLRRPDGTPVLCGDFPHWGGKFYAFDTENAEFRAYLRDTLRKVFAEWGFRFLKADFLYASARIPAGGLTRAQRGVRAHQFLWDLCREHGASLLSCGATLASAYGRCEFSRIGPDVEPSWKEVPPDGVGSREACSNHHGIMNAVTRAFLDGVAFFNDPDVFFLREQSCTLTPQEKAFLARVNAGFGSLLFCSDNVSEYGPWQRVTLEEVRGICGAARPGCRPSLVSLDRTLAAGRSPGNRETLTVVRDGDVWEVDFAAREARIRRP